MRHIRMRLAFFMLMVISISAMGQQVDTLTFYSRIFKAKRSVIIHTPEFSRYRAESTTLPVIYVLDGQHEWFVNPVLSDIRYLQYTHEIPNAIVVVIPHQDRIRECAIRDMNKGLALDSFITQEVEEKIRPYHPNEFRMIIGHSFSASFSLFSYSQHPGFYSAVIANSPLDKLDELIGRMENDPLVNKAGICVSVGGISRDKDYFHRVVYDSLKLKHASFFRSVHLFEADQSYHNAVPIVATPALLTAVFADFKSRYTRFAEVNEEYKLVVKPSDPEAEYVRIMAASQLGKYFYAPEIPDVNGMASRYESNGFPAQALKIYEAGTRFYPYYPGFYLSLYDLLKDTDRQKALTYLRKAEQLLKTREPKNTENKALLKTISEELVKAGSR